MSVDHYSGGDYNVDVDVYIHAGDGVGEYDYEGKKIAFTPLLWMMIYNHYVQTTEGHHMTLFMILCNFHGAHDLQFSNQR